MSRVTIYFLFWTQLFVLIASSLMTGLNAALGDVDNSIIWGLITVAMAFCEFLVFREMLKVVKPPKRKRPKPKKVKKEVDPDPYGPSA
ncbi:hypothetical protein IK146_02905 [Candidatus Saccharibacteria bacterium]|nr:hypothetical protein [Candidatus Saccharibacteria bacterium]